MLGLLGWARVAEWEERESAVQPRARGKPGKGRASQDSQDT